ncbi:hypothetical protein A0J61_10891 [Choanephora cucurbitarum]|uniref:Uncharacterized protein n=1 Tax=Choanephora cucurbitarum TaxID=101091 RepID=A0A1C7MW57_9FUNG|nr:hypothetical protein A0J61_10891 [Choanephora cucurbitarum]
MYDEIVQLVNLQSIVADPERMDATSEAVKEAISTEYDVILYDHQNDQYGHMWTQEKKDEEDIDVVVEDECGSSNVDIDEDKGDSASVSVDPKHTGNDGCSNCSEISNSTPESFFIADPTNRDSSNFDATGQLKEQNMQVFFSRRILFRPHMQVRIAR